MLALIHLILVILTALIVLYADEQAAMWVLGKKETLDSKRITLLHTLVTFGLVLILCTGGLLYVQGVDAYLSLPTFLVKLAAITALIINTYAIGRFSAVAYVRTFASLSLKKRIPLFISGGISLIGWITAITCGLLIA